MKGPELDPARLRLIVLTDASLAAPRSLVDIVRAALAGGAPAIQLRDKDGSARDMAELGRVLRTLTRESSALLFVNDRLDVALAIGADGVHLGPDDLPVAAVRASVPDAFLIGRSCDDPEQARAFVSEGASYIGCGTVFPTRTKTDAGPAIGTHGLQAVVRAVPVPVVGIGGIDEAGARSIRSETDAAGVAVVGAVMSAPDPAAAVRSLMEPWIPQRVE